MTLRPALTYGTPMCPVALSFSRLELVEFSKVAAAFESTASGSVAVGVV